MQANGHLVQVALPIEAYCIYELLIFLDTVGRLQVLAQKGVKVLEVDVKNAVGLGQEAACRGGRPGAQEDRRGQRKQDRSHYPERSPPGLVHFPRLSRNRAKLNPSIPA